MACLAHFRCRFILCAVVAVLVLGGGSARADFTFGRPLNLGPIVNSSMNEWGSWISADGLELYFASNRGGGSGGADLWVTTRSTTDDDWTTPVNLGPTINSSYIDSMPSISSDGLELYFGSNRPGGPGNGDIWVTKRATKNDPWEEPVNLGPTVNSSSLDTGPSITADGLTLYFNSNRPGGEGGTDLWLTTRATTSDPWGDPVNLGPIINSSVGEWYSCLSADGLMLFIQDDNLDLCVTQRETTEEPFGPAVKLPPHINMLRNEGAPSLSSDGSTLYFSSNRRGGYGWHDTWQVSIDPVVDLNGDGRVDCGDMCIMMDCLDSNEPLCDIAPMPWGDGVVDLNDLIVLAENLHPGLDDNVIERRISAGSDDAEESLSLNPGSNTWNYSKILQLVDDDLNNRGRQLVGMTFRDIDIEPGEVISAAYIEFVCSLVTNGTDDTYLLIWGHLTENSEGFVEPFVISNRPQTEAKVPWQPDPWDAGGQTIQTVNIAPIIQELIDQPGWAAGNAVEIIIGADPDRPEFTGVRGAVAYDGSPYSAPLLHIEIAAP